jgi:hypothetical protein
VCAVSAESASSKHTKKKKKNLFIFLNLIMLFLLQCCNKICAEFAQCHNVQRFRALLGLLSCPASLLLFVLDALAANSNLRLQLTSPKTSAKTSALADKTPAAGQPAPLPGLPNVAISDGGRTLFFVLADAETHEALPLAQSASSCKKTPFICVVLLRLLSTCTLVSFLH